MKRALAIALALGLVSLATAEDRGSERLAGRSLAEALRLLESRGVRVLFSTELVRPEMRVAREPLEKRPRQLLLEILAPHGLAVKRGPGGRWLVVSAPARSAAPPAPGEQPPPRLGFEEKLEVADTLDPEPLLSGVSVASSQVSATAGGLENVFHTLQLLPGVTAPQEFAGRLAVRGGGPDQNLTLMDGVEVHNPHRLFGLTSAFNPDTVDRFELFTGAFSARHGDRLSSLLVIESRNGSDARRLQGSSSLGLTDSNVVLEGRLPAGRRGSWLFTARRTYYDLLAERLVSANFPDFADVQLRATWEPRPGQRATFQGLLSREGTNASSQQFDSSENDFSVVARTRTALVSGTWDMALGTRARLRSILSLSDLTDRFEMQSQIHLESRRSNLLVDDAARDAVSFLRRVGVRDLAARQELSWLLGRHALHTGLELHRMQSHWRIANGGDTAVALTGALLRFGDSEDLFPRALLSTRNGLRLGGWIEDRVQPTSRLTLLPGLRFDHVGATGELLVSPRLGATLALDRATRLTLAAGLHYQSPGYEKLYQGDLFVDLSAANAGALRSERAFQSVLGIERDLPAGLRLRAEAYRRRLDRLIVGRLESEAERAARVGRYDFPASLLGEIPSASLITPFPVNGGRGQASGFELLLEKRAAPASSRPAGWLSYAWGSARRESYGIEVPFDYHRSHAASAVGQFRFSPRLELSMSAHAASGVPFTPARSVRLSSAFDAADLDGDGDRVERVPARDDLSGAFVYEPDFGALANVNSKRLPMVARLDFRLSYKPRGAPGRWLFYVDVINALGRRNGFLVVPELRFNPDGERPRVFHVMGGGFPRLPSFGVRFRF